MMACALCGLLFLLVAPSRDLRHAQHSQQYTTQQPALAQASQQGADGMLRTTEVDPLRPTIFRSDQRSAAEPARKCDCTDSCKPHSLLPQLLDHSNGSSMIHLSQIPAVLRGMGMRLSDRDDFLYFDRLQLATYLKSEAFTQRKAHALGGGSGGGRGGWVNASSSSVSSGGGGVPVASSGDTSSGTNAAGLNNTATSPTVPQEARQQLGGGASSTAGTQTGLLGGPRQQDQQQQGGQSRPREEGQSQQQQPYPDYQYSGRGIVISSAHRHQQGATYITLRVLREVLNSSLPVQVCDCVRACTHVCARVTCMYITLCVLREVLNSSVSVRVCVCAPVCACVHACRLREGS